MVPTWPTFVPACGDVRLLIEAVIPDATGVDRMQLASENTVSARFFRVAQSSGMPRFLKLLQADELPAVSEAERIVARLPKEAGAVTSCGTYSLRDGSGRALVAYPFVEARYVDSNPRDLSALGRAVAMLHAALREVEERIAIEARAQARTRSLDATLRTSGGTGPSGGALGLSVRFEDLLDMLDGADAQPLHGDLNPGNILCDRESGAIRFLDFEDVRHSFGPPLLDLALPLERLCLLHDDEAEAVASAVFLLRAYAAARGTAPIASRGALGAALRFINMRAIALMLQRSEAGLDAAPEEWRKFSTLLKRHEERHRVIAEIERAFL